MNCKVPFHVLLGWLVNMGLESVQDYISWWIVFRPTYRADEIIVSPINLKNDFLDHDTTPLPELIDICILPRFSL